VIPADEILDALDLSRAQPGSGFLEALFARFNAKVPFENASKIVRNAQVVDPSAKPRTPEIFWEEHLASGTGGTCFARVAAFEALLGSLGFRCRQVLGSIQREGDHAALIVETAAGESIVDVGFPLPAILPARPGRAGTAQGELEVVATARGFRIVFLEGVPETPREFEVYAESVPDERFAALWRETFRPKSRFLQDVHLRRDLGNRVLSFAAGEVRVDDLHSRLCVPLPVPRAAALSELFGIDAAILSGAFAEVGDVSGDAGENARLTAYLETDAAAERAFAAIATQESYRRLLAGVADVAVVEETPEGYRLALSAPSVDGPGSAIEEDVSTDVSARRVAIVRRHGGSESVSSFRVLTRGEKTYLVREAKLSGVREDLLRNDSLRGRLAGTLAVDLLAWARML
jgi:arylamine N-acetyltransferase